jgi:hypothetical protein
MGFDVSGRQFAAFAVPRSNYFARRYSPGKDRLGVLLAAVSPVPASRVVIVIVIGRPRSTSSVVAKAVVVLVILGVAVAILGGVRLRTFLAFVQVPVAHHGMRVEVVKWLRSQALLAELGIHYRTLI